MKTYVLYCEWGSWDNASWQIIYAGDSESDAFELAKSLPKNIDGFTVYFQLQKWNDGEKISEIEVTNLINE
jgi:hypothetical protein